MKLAEALDIADRAIAKAEEMKIAISVAVLDEFGQLVQLDRMDGAPPMSPDLAEAKAATALNFRQSTSALSAMSPQSLEAISGSVFFKVLAVPGGVPIVEGGQVKGAVGVSGDNTARDETLAHHAASQA
jgi:uncharacterized protein GlcG (DUF336 family)